TGTKGSGSALRSPATRRTRSCGVSSTSPAPARPSTTCSPTDYPSPSTSRPADPAGCGRIAGIGEHVMPYAETVIIGAGHAGLAVSRCLADRGLPHVVLDRGDVGDRWRTARWDSFRLLTPNWLSRLPGRAYTGRDPDGFMTAGEFVDYLREYARSFD